MKLKAIALAIMPVIFTGCTTTEVKEVQNKGEIEKIVVEGKKLESKPGYVIYADNDLHQYFIPKNVNSRDEIPNVKVKSSFHLIDYNLNGIMSMLTDAVDMSFIIDREVVDQKSISSFRLKGEFPQIMEQIGRAYDVVFDVNGNNIHIKKRTQYTVGLPPMNMAAKRVVVGNLIKYGATEVDASSTNTIQYVADQRASQKISGYLDMVRQTNSLITYDVYIWDVEVGREQSIDWGAYQNVVKRLDGERTMELNMSSKVAMSSNCQDSSAIDPELIQAFLLTQGKVKLYKNPDFMILTGTKEGVNFTKYMDEGNSQGRSKTDIRFTPNYTGGLVKTSLEINMGAFSKDKSWLDTDSKLSNKVSFSTYPGGTSLITGIEAPNSNKEKRSEIAVYVKPSVILLEKPKGDFIERQNYQAEFACRTEKSRQESSSALKLLLNKK